MLDGSVVSLRSFDRKHLDRTRSWNNDPEICRLLGRFRPVSDLEHERWILSTLQRQDTVFLAIETKAESLHIGNVWLTEIDARHRKAEVRILLGDGAARGQGAGTEALRLLGDYAFGELNLSKVYAYVLGINPRAKRAFEKAGFAVEGVLKADRWTGEGWTDVYFLGRVRDDRK